MKKFIAIFAAIFMVASLLTACATSQTESSSSESPNQSSSNDETNNNDKKIKILTTIFPIYDWTKSILGDNSENIELKLLLENGVDLHSYQPTTDDIIKILDADLFIYVGGESDTWVNEIVKNNDTSNMKIISLFDILGDDVKTEEIVEGMEHNHEHEDGEDDHDHEHEDGDDEHDHDHEDGDDEHNHEHEDGDDEHHHSGEVENDEHVWLSLENAEKICNAISNELSKIDSTNSANYKDNNDKYVAKLDALDNKFENSIESSKHNTLLFADRFPFRYLVDDYDLDYYAAFVGCSAETEASFETIVFLAEKINELGLSHILVIDDSDSTIAQTVVSSTKDKNQEILSLNSMQSTTIKDVQNGASYLSIMEENLTTLEKALS